MSRTKTDSKVSILSYILSFLSSDFDPFLASNQSASDFRQLTVKNKRLELYPVHNATLTQRGLNQNHHRPPGRGLSQN